MYPIIPLPHDLHLTDARVTLPATVAASLYDNAAATLIDYARRTHGISFARVDTGAVVFTTDSSLPAEGYRVTVTDSSVTVASADLLGAQNAAATLVQLMTPAEGGFSLPMGTIQDAPDCSWRGVMIDLARDWHELPVLYEYVDMCRFYKIKYLHLHFTDDQSYTLPSRAYPGLSTEGRSYTEEELRGVIAYAKARGVQIIPEIDVPGHCTSFAEAYGDIFGRDGIICLSDESIAGMKTLFSELCELFADSDYIHIGGDEAAIEKWTTCDKCLAAFRARGVDVDNTEKRALAEIMYATFIAEMCEAVITAGKTPVVWEGFAAEVNHLIPREAVIMSWENFYQTTPSLQAAGFRLVNCSWSPMYVVTPVVYWTPEQVYDWSVYKWMPVHPGSPYLNVGLEIQPTEQVEGGQLLAWGDHIVKQFENVAEGVREEQRLIEERTPALSEGTWHRQKPTDWNDFSARMTAVAALYETFRTNK